MLRCNELTRLADRLKCLHAEVYPAGSDRPDAVAERSLLCRALGAAEDQKVSSGRVRIHLTILRKRLLDEENAAGGVKYLVDCLRYAGAIRNDTTEDVILTWEQKKVEGKDGVEAAIIELFYPDNYDPKTGESHAETTDRTDPPPASTSGA